MGENIHYERADDVKPGSNTKVIPVNFSRDNKTMISTMAQLFQDHKIAVSPEFDKLAVALRSAVVDEYRLLKDQSAYNDLTDAISLSLKCYRMNS